LSFEGLIARAMRIGVDQIAYPIDIFSTATELANHPQATEKFDKILGLVEDKENYFTRWTAIRAIGLMDPKLIERARSTLERQSEVEDYELALNQINDALKKLA
jgi:hypothetical protein